uniref:At1g61320/AtMIF1 LRR domain-containing protein n=1 Tax=Oryza punctata TaxID=4537 RepID=A0A0E0MC11_ORYPU
MGLAKIQERLKTSTIRLFVEKTLKHILTGNPSVLPLVETLCIEVGIETQMPVFTQSPLKFTPSKHLTIEITFSHCPFNTNSVFQLAYLLEAAPLLEDLYLDMFCSLYSNPLDLDDIVDHPHYISRQNALILEHMVIDPKGTSNTPLFGQKAAVEEKLAPALGSHRSKYTS